MKRTESKTGRHSGTILPALSCLSFAKFCGSSIRAVLGLSVIILVCSWTDRFAAAQEEHDFRICQGDYALCSASTCTPTGKSIRVNVPSENTTRLFPEADCTCPIFSGFAIADVIGGNMNRSCQPPGSNQVWSIFNLMLTNYPQAINNWVTSGPGAVAPPLFCPAQLGQGDQQVNCFSFACDRAGQTANGVPIATCHCALGESPAGMPVRPRTAFLTQTGQNNIQFCSKHPVAGTISLD
jgi:hypothetical protein